MNTFLFRAFHGSYTGGVCVIQAQTREDAIQLVLKKITENERVRKNYESIKQRIDEAYDAVFEKNPDAERVAAKRFEDPIEEWQNVWNDLVPFPKEDPWIGGRVIRKKLYDTLPDNADHISFGTWTEGWGNSKTDDEEDEFKSFIDRARNELESCTLKYYAFLSFTANIF